jgi:hypothetical protein
MGSGSNFFSQVGGAVRQLPGSSIANWGQHALGTVGQVSAPGANNLLDAGNGEYGSGRFQGVNPTGAPISLANANVGYGAPMLAQNGNVPLGQMFGTGGK